MFLFYQKIQCSKCGEWKSKNEFYKDRSSKSGCTSYCKSCSLSNAKKWNSSHVEDKKAYHKKRRQDNLEKMREGERKYARMRYANNPDAVREINRKSYRANAEKRREDKKKWYYSNLDKVRREAREKYRKYKETSPEKKQIRDRNRRAREKGAGGMITVKEWKALKERCDFTCLRCKRKEPEIKLTPDHVMPLALGGSNSIDNIQPLCAPCNSSKNARYIDYR